MYFDAIELKNNDRFVFENLPKEARGKFFKMDKTELDRASFGDSKSKMVLDASFNFLTSELQKLHPETYKPLFNTTYAQDVDIDVGGGWVEFVSYYKVDYAAIASWAKNLTGDSANIVPRVNVEPAQGNAKVFTFQLGYDIRFVQMKLFDKIKMAKDIKSIYEDAMLAAWELFSQEIAYLGVNGTTGLFNNTTVVPVSVLGISKDDIEDGTVTDEQLNAVVNGIISAAMDATNRNAALIPNRLLVPTWFSKALSDRMSALYTNNLLGYLREHNLAVDEALLPKLEIFGRPALNTLGTNGVGRIVAYHKDKRFVRLDVPVPFQHLITLPNMERMAYTTVFAGQISEIQFPYNSSTDEFAPIQYLDFAE